MAAASFCICSGRASVVKSRSVTQPAQHRVAHTAADQIQLVARVGEQPAEFAQHVAVPVQAHLRGGQQLGILRQRSGHVRTSLVAVPS